MKESKATRERVKKETLEIGKQYGEKFAHAADNFMKSMVVDGVTPKDAIGLDKGALENVYAQAYRLYNTGKYIEAAHLFRMLILMNSLEAKYTMGLAACLQMVKEYQNAAYTYAMYSALEPNDPMPFYYSSDCYIQMKDHLSAMLCLQMTIDKAGNKPEFSQLKERALLSLNSLKQNSPEVQAKTLDEES